MHSVRRAAELQLIGRLGQAMEKASWRTCRTVGARMGLAFFYGFKKRRAVALSNVKLVFPELSEAEITVIARNSAQNFGMSFCEFLHLNKASQREVADYCTWQGVEHLEQALHAGHGALLPTAHFGAWEVMGARVAQQFPLTVMVRLTSNRTLREHIQKVREAAGIAMIVKDDSARASLQVLRNGGALAIFPDQHAGPTGTLLPIFGHPTRVFTSPARLALRSKSPIVPIYAVRRSPFIENGSVDIHVGPGLTLHEGSYTSRDEAVLAGTNFILQGMEEKVRMYRDQWLWMHRRWRPQDALDAAAAAATGQAAAL